MFETKKMFMLVVLGYKENSSVVLSQRVKEQVFYGDASSFRTITDRFAKFNVRLFLKTSEP